MSVTKFERTKNLTERIKEGSETKETLGNYLRAMQEIREFEESVFELLGRNKIEGASHLYALEEAIAVGAISAIGPDDVIASTHRGHGHCGARGVFYAGDNEQKRQHMRWRLMVQFFHIFSAFHRRESRGGPS